MVEYWPPDAITNYGIEVLQDGIQPQITFTSYDGQAVWYLNGGLAPIPGVTEGVVLTDGVAGLHAPFNQLSQKGARQVGSTWNATVYDPTLMTLKVTATARTRDRLRNVISKWMQSWPPEQKGILSWVTPDSGEWWCTARPNRATPDKLVYQTGVRKQEFTWSVHNSKAMWAGPDSTSQFSFGYHDSFDNFDRMNLANLGPNWAQTYTGSVGSPVAIDSSGTGTVATNAGGLEFTLTAESTYTVGASANYVVAAVPFVSGLLPEITVNYGSHAMTQLGMSISGGGGIAFFGLANPPSGQQNVTATVSSISGVYGIALACASFEGVGSAIYTQALNGEGNSPAQTVTPTMYGELVVWGVANYAGSNVDTTISDFNHTTLATAGPLSLELEDGLSMLLGYASGGSQNSSSEVTFSADIAEANIDQWWAAGALTLLPEGDIGTCGTSSATNGGINTSTGLATNGMALWTPAGTAAAGVINKWLGQNAVQTVTVGGDPTSFDLTYDGVTSSAITYPATAASVQSAVTAMTPVIETGQALVTTPVLFDTVGTGASSPPGAPSTTLSWTHTGVGNYALAFVSVYQGTVASATFGGVNMTLLTSQAFDNVAGNGKLYVYGLASPPSGGQTVEVTLGAAAYATGNTVSYCNVNTVTAQASVYGNGLLCSMTTPAGSDVVVQAFGTQISQLAHNGDGTLRYHGYAEDITGIFNFAGLQIAEGVEGNAFLASLPIVDVPWAGVELVLTATTAATNGPFAIEFTGALAGQKVLPLTGTTTGGTATSLAVAQTQLGMGAVSATDNQIITAQFGSFYTWPFDDGAYIDLWARWDGNTTSPTGIRMRVSVDAVTLSRFNSGVETVMNIAWLPITPFPWDTYTLICGTPANSRVYEIQLNGITIYQFTEVDNGSALGPSYRHTGFGMTAGAQFDILTNTWSQASPPTLSNWTFADNITVTQSGTLPLTNFGDLEEFPDFLCYGPGTFTFGDGPGVDPTISFGPLADNQIALVRTDPSYRGVYDLSFAASQQVLNQFQDFVESLFSLAFNYNIPPLVSWWESLFGITPQQGNMYSLLNGRWSNGVPARPTSGTPPTYEWAVTITDGNASSQVVAALTPRRRWPE